MLRQADFSHAVVDEASLELTAQNFTAVTHSQNWSDTAHRLGLLIAPLTVDLFR